MYLEDIENYETTGAVIQAIREEFAVLSIEKK